MNKVESYKEKILSEKNLMDLMYESDDNYNKLTNYIDKFLYYKEQKDGIDIDVCKYNIFIYGTCYQSIKLSNTSLISKQGTCRNKYELSIESENNKICYRGDTAINVLSLMKLVNIEDIKDKELFALMNDYAFLCYCVGNFYPIPFCFNDEISCSLNLSKGTCKQNVLGKDANKLFGDSMYVYLQFIYRLFEKYGGDWKKYIENNYFQPFVVKDDKNNFPIDFWKTDENNRIGILKKYLESINSALRERNKIILEKVEKINSEHIINDILP